MVNDGLRLDFEAIRSGRSHTVGPVPFIVIHGRELRVGPDDELTAQYDNHQWTCRGEWFTALRISLPVRVSFGHSERMVAKGPFAQLKFVNGYLRTGHDHSALLARHDEPTGLWFVYPEDSAFEWILVETAESGIRSQDLLTPDP
jgi:hypothetical protein